MTTDGFGTITVVKCSSFEEAQSKAGQEAANTIGFPIPVVIFRQGSRWNLSGALPFAFVASRLESRSAVKGKSGIAETTEAMNRPEDPAHSETIAEYLKMNHGGKYVLPPLTLNVQEQARLYTATNEAKLMTGFLVLPHTARMAITDGQHRCKGIVRALAALPFEKRKDLEGDGIAVMITCELDMPQIHQDFADCSKTKQLPPSQLAVYDRRNPANRLVLDLEKECPIFRGKIDATSKTLGKKSPYLFLANQLRQLVKVLLFGSWQMADDDFEKRSVEYLEQQPDGYNKSLIQFVEYVNFLTEVIPVWKRIVSIQSGVQTAQIPAMREQGFVCMRAMGLVILGKIGHEVIRDDVANWKTYAQRLGESVDWSKDAEIWQGNVVSPDGKIVTGQKFVREATQKVLDKIDWRPKVGVESEVDAPEDATIAVE